jgi:hypothetical protein
LHGAIDERCVHDLRTCDAPTDHDRGDKERGSLAAGPESWLLHARENACSPK